MQMMADVIFVGSQTAFQEIRVKLPESQTCNMPVAQLSHESETRGVTHTSTKGRDTQRGDRGRTASSALVFVFIFEFT